MHLFYPLSLSIIHVKWKRARKYKIVSLENLQVLNRSMFMDNCFGAINCVFIVYYVRAWSLLFTSQSTWLPNDCSKHYSTKMIIESRSWYILHNIESPCLVQLTHHRNTLSIGYLHLITFYSVLMLTLPPENVHFIHSQNAARALYMGLLTSLWPHLEKPKIAHLSSP